MKSIQCALARQASAVAAVTLIPALLLALAPAPARSQDFPTRAVTLIVPFPTGSTTDIIARHIIGPLGERLKQPVIIDNKLGAGGVVGVNALKNAPKDGYTIGLLVSGNVIQPWLDKNLPFDVRKDFIPMSAMYVGQYVLNVAPTFPAKDIAEFLAYAKANPTKLFFGSSGNGTTTHLAGELMKQLTGIQMTHVPFKGSPQVVAAVLSGDVQTYFDLYGTSKPLLDAGRVRAIGVSSKQRIPQLPQVPAIAESVPGFEVLVWTGFATPLGVPKNATDRLTVALREVMAVPEVAKRIAALGVEPGGNSPTEFQSFINSEYEKWGKIILEAGIKPQ